MEDNEKASLLPYTISFVVFLVITIRGKFFYDGLDDMGFILANFYFMTPMITIISGFLIGVKDDPFKWVYPILFGALGVILPAYIFDASIDLFALNFAFLPALIGIFIGLGVYNYRIKKPK